MASALPVEPWPAMRWGDRPLRIRRPRRSHRIQLRVLIVLATAALLAFLFWLLRPQRVGDPWLYWPLTLVTLLAAAGWLLEWWNYWNIDVPRRQRAKRPYTVDVLTTACPGEPQGMIVRTLIAMTRIRYPHTSYLCDEGNDPVLKQVCERLGVIHVTREKKLNAKAGNINNALRQATGELCVVLDPDHEPAPFFLDRVVGYFEDESVGFVQTIQAYRNQHESLVARGAAEQSYHFYGPTMMGMGRLGTVQAIGANCVFRRTALDSIGGHAPGLAEDMHTAMRLFGAGWRGKYVPEALTRGLVPADLSAYYKQQLKWACGVFDLLYLVYPRMFRHFTLWQKLQYLIAPTYFLRGLLTLVGMVVAVLCLTFGLVAWRFQLSEFVGWVLPVIVLSLLLRQAIQRWLLEPSEHGLHAVGGLLYTGTWWVHLIGFLCACLRIKVPYIPTPKEGEVRDHWKLALPNFAAAALCLLAGVWGIRHDYTPFSLIMAGFALCMSLAFVFTAALGQVRTIGRALEMTRWLWGSAADAGSVALRAYRMGLKTTRHAALPIAMVFVLALGAGVIVPPIMGSNKAHEMAWSGLIRQKDFGGFYLGVSAGGAASAPADVRAMSGRSRHVFGRAFDLEVMTLRWGVDPMPEQRMREAWSAGAVPLICWELADEGAEAADVAEGESVYRRIVAGAYEDYTVQAAQVIVSLGEPVLITFAPRGGEATAGASEVAPEDYRMAFRYLVDTFSIHGAMNTGWVWSTFDPASEQAYYPGERFVNWIAVDASRAERLAERCEAARAVVDARSVPLLLTGVGPGHAVSAARYARTNPQVAGLVLADAPELWRNASPIRDALAGLPASRAIDGHRLAERGLWGDGPIKPPVGEHVRVASHGDNKWFELMVKGEPFYVRGVAYNPGHDWRDNNIHPTRRQLEIDFEMIKAMGGNTIRRYGASIYDQNVFQVAAEKDIKVLYGFWLDQDMDYAADEAGKRRLEQRVREKVLAYRDEPSLLAWSLGNEVWGRLGVGFQQPYLTRVRQEHVRFVEHLTQMIHELDPAHPVMVVHEHTPELGGAVLDFSRGAPSVELIGVNSYYEDHLEELDKVVWRFEKQRPYLVTEFGPDGYWRAVETYQVDIASIDERSAAEKASQYRDRWDRYIEGHLGLNVGGVAYCWKDRFEATTTWFGLTTFDNQPKPAYFALREAWARQPMPSGPKITALEAERTRVSPGEKLAIAAVVDGDVGELSMHWEVVGRNFAHRAAKLELSKDGSAVVFTAPSTPGVYRVYAEARTARGLDQRNLPIVVTSSAEDDESQMLAAKHARLHQHVN